MPAGRGGAIGFPQPSWPFMDLAMKTAPALLTGLAIWSWAALATAAQFVYPARGQSVGLQAHDEAECSHRAARQSGFAPVHGLPADDKAKATNSQQQPAGRAAYDRSRAACLAGRGYSVR